MIELVKIYFPNASHKEADEIAWNCICFPFGNIKTYRKQLKKAARESGGSPELAIKQAYDDVDRAMALYKWKYKDKIKQEQDGHC